MLTGTTVRCGHTWGNPGSPFRRFAAGSAPCTAAICGKVEDSMVFSSMVFLWIFLPLVFVLSLVIRKTRYQNILLLIFSLIFYAWGEPSYIFLLLASVFLNWVFGLSIYRFQERRKLFLVLDIIVNLGLLGYYKYANFTLNTLRHFIPSVPVTNIALPIGISFFTFQAMSYVIDLYRGKCDVQKNLLHMALYISFFPQLIAGPIVKYKDIEDQIGKREVTKEGIALGFRRFIYGLGKKVILSNLVGQVVDKLFGLEITQLTGGMAWCAAILYTLQIYYDFSGYSDMAIGLGHMFGFTFMENFNYPYISRSIREFWRRWHISLSSWFRDYVYIPLGGNRKGQHRTYLNLFIVFFLTGLWHGASWTFVIWGLYHGFFIIVERMGLGKLLDRSQILSRIYAVLVFVFGWVFFRADTIRQGFAVAARMAMPWRYTVTDSPLGTLMSGQAVLAAAAGIIGCGILQMLFSRGILAKVSAKWKNSLPEAVYLGGVLFYSILLLADNTYNPFIYFRF